MTAKLKTRSVCFRLGSVILHRDAKKFTLVICDRKGAVPAMAALTKAQAAKLVEAITTLSQCPWREVSRRSGAIANVTEKR